jgi:hypothetical protein
MCVGQSLPFGATLKTLRALTGFALGLALLRDSAAQSPWTISPLQEARRTGTFRNPELNESSGVIPSRTQPGVLWSFDDSGGPARIFATDTTGADLGSFAVRGARNIDWEAMSSGRCGKSDCIYIADTGDNSEVRGLVDLYRLPEPSVRTSSGAARAIPRVERLQVRYPDRPRDVEAMFVDSRGDVHLISKGRTDGFVHYRIRASAWSKRSAVAEVLGTLPIERDGSLGHLVTDAALAPDGRRVAVRTYQEVFLFQLTERGTLLPAGSGCSIGGLDLQGEGIGWLDRDTLVLTSEGLLGLPGTISVGQCTGSEPRNS